MCPPLLLLLLLRRKYQRIGALPVGLVGYAPQMARLAMPQQPGYKGVKVPKKTLQRTQRTPRAVQAAGSPDQQQAGRVATRTAWNTIDGGERCSANRAADAPGHRVGDDGRGQACALGVSRGAHPAGEQAVAGVVRVPHHVERVELALPQACPHLTVRVQVPALCSPPPAAADVSKCTDSRLHQHSSALSVMAHFTVQE
jgi:hypothetical protein